MHRLRDLLVILAVATAVPGLSLVLGQEPKPVAEREPAKGAPVPAPAVTVEVEAVLLPPPAAKAEMQKAAAAPEPAKKAEEAKPVTRTKVQGMILLQPAMKAQVKEAVGKAAPAEKARPAEKAEAKAVMKAAVVRAARVMPAAVIDAQVAQYIQQFRPLARGEYYFLRHLCGLAGDDRKKLAEVAEHAARGAARQFVEAQQNLMRGGIRNGTGYPDPHKLVEDEFSKRADFLSPEQRQRYQHERELRAASRRQMFIDNLVAKLDADLVLSTEQREQLGAALRKNWNEAWGQSVDMLQNLDNFFPNIPDPVITPILSEKQRAAWRRIPKNQGVFFGFGGGMMATWDPDPLDDPELAQARKAIEAKEKK